MERMEKLREFLKASPADSFLQHALALEHIKLGEDEAARQLFEEILTREPGYAGSYYHLGKLWERMGNFEQAAVIYEKGMAECRKVDDRHAYNELQMALEEISE